MTVVFIHPPPCIGLSGGQVFNRQLLAEARLRDFPLESRPLPPGEAQPASIHCPAGGAVLWDSLFLPDLASHPLEETGTAHGLLAHYLPFLNPLLPPGQARAWARRFDLAAGRMCFLIATGAGAARILERRYPGKPVFLCEPGVAPEFAAARGIAREPGPNRPLRIATVANLLPAKGHGELLAALADIEPMDWEWHIVGEERTEPAYARAFWARVEDAGLSGRIVRHGVLDSPKLAELLGHMDIFACASHFEAYGMALAEAAAVGLPIVTTAVGEAERIVRHGETGFVAPVDAPERFRADLAGLIGDVGLRRRFRARLLAERPRGWDEAFGDFERCVKAIGG